ncbi:RpoE-regulated lipoprotein [Candidatus Sodalis endolongispinus]|nr:RpoE-regulated lipoprotein [Candidatus Sodalis endolongispinus]
MMNLFRPLIIGLPLVLAGCSTLSGLSWSSFSPFHWFAESRKVSDQGVGSITAATPMTQPALEKALDGDYRLRGGMETRNGEIVSVYQALAKDQVKLTAYGPSSGRVAEVVVTDEAIESAWGVKIGTPFSALDQKAYGACSKGSGEDRDAVVCQAPQSAHVSYVFKCIWHGPESLMPADDQLRTWQVSKIIWRASAAR